MLASKIEYTVVLGSLKTSPLGDLTNSQLFALSVASNEDQILHRAIDDVEEVAHKGNSTLFANALGQQWAQATIASFGSGSVQENGEGYEYTA